MNLVVSFIKTRRSTLAGPGLLVLAGVSTVLSGCVVADEAPIEGDGRADVRPFGEGDLVFLSETVTTPGGNRRSDYIGWARQRHATIQDDALRIFDFGDDAHVIWNRFDGTVTLRDETHRHGLSSMFLMRFTGDTSELVVEQTPDGEQPRVFVIDRDGAASLYVSEGEECASCKRFWLQHFAFAQEGVEVVASYLSGDAFCSAVAAATGVTTAATGPGALAAAVLASRACALAVGAGVKYLIHRANLSFAENLAERWCYDFRGICRYSGFCQSTYLVPWDLRDQPVVNDVYYTIENFGQRAGELVVEVLAESRATGRTHLLAEVTVHKEPWILGFNDRWRSEDDALRVFRERDGTLTVTHENPLLEDGAITSSLRCQ